MSTLPALVVAAAVASLATAAPAQAAPAITTDHACYSIYTPLRISGTGFTPGGAVRLSETWIDPDGSSRFGPALTATADSTGAFTYAQELPEIFVDHLDLNITATDAVLAAQGATAAEHSVATTVRVSFFGAFYPAWNTDGPAPGRPGFASELDVGGYIDSNSRTLFVHYIRRGRLVKTLRVGALSGSCGTLTKRFREFAFRPVPAGTYSVRFDTTRAWPNDDMWSGYRRVKVTRPARRASSRRGLPPASR
jgi:hypothetical protein